MNLTVFTHCIASIMKDEGKFRLYPNSRFYDIEIKPRRTEGLDSTWDQVYIDGEWCGNRLGGVHRLAELVEAELDSERSPESYLPILTVTDEDGQSVEIDLNLGPGDYLY